MYLLGFFFMARLLPPLPKANLHGFTLVELLVCLSISAVLLGFALPSVWRWHDRARIDSVRQQLFNDLQLARVRALQWGQRLQMSRLSGCAKSSTSANEVAWTHNDAVTAGNVIFAFKRSDGAGGSGNDLVIRAFEDIHCIIIFEY